MAVPGPDTATDEGAEGHPTHSVVGTSGELHIAHRRTFLWQKGPRPPFLYTVDANGGCATFSVLSRDIFGYAISGKSWSSPPKISASENMQTKTVHFL